MLSIEQFVPFYPFFHGNKEYNQGLYGDLSPTESLVHKKEFLDNKLGPTIEGELTSSKFFKHQNTISNFINSNTAYDSILIFHSMGTGKTSTVINAIETSKTRNLVWNLEKNVPRALIIVKNSSLERNFISELTKILPDIYLPDNYDDLTEMEKVRRTNKLVSKYYEIQQMETFAKKLERMTDVEIQSTYSGRIIVIDEIHNIRQTHNKKFNMYDIYHRFLHIIENKKIIVMSGTPMKDRVAEIASVMNLILPLSEQLPTGEQFMKEFFIQDVLNVNKIPELERKFYGRVSYLKTNYGDKINIQYQGRSNIVLEEGKVIRHFKIYESKMSPFQQKVYDKAYASDTSSSSDVRDIDAEDQAREEKALAIYNKDPEKTTIKGIYLNSRQASDFVFPNKMIGMPGFRHYIQMKTKKNLIEDEDSKNKYTLSSEMTFLFKERKTIQDKLNLLKQYSAKDHAIIQSILNNPTEKVFVAGEFVTGAGLILFSKILELFGFSRFKGNETSPKKRYILITGETSSKQISNVIRQFNQAKNAHGDYVQVIIGSKIISEGVSFSDTVQCHIRDPHWNFGDLEQFIYRIIRATSYENLLKETSEKINVRIYLHAATTSEQKESIDVLMYYISEWKDLLIKQIEHIIKRSAFDCYLNYERNKRDSSLDGTRDCEYTNCYYSCNDVNLEKLKLYPVITDTYSLFYSDSQVQQIKDQIKVIFQTRFFITLQEILDQLQFFSSYLVLKALGEMILLNEKIQNQYYIDCYLKEQSNMYYLIYQNNINSRFEDVFYTIYPSLDVENFEGVKHDLLIEKIKQCCSKQTSYESIKSHLSVQVQSMFIEEAILSDQLKNSKNPNLTRQVLEIYKSYIQRHDNHIICKFSGYRCLDLSSLKWSNCPPYVIKNIEEKINVDVKNNKYGYYGIIDKKGLFKIIDIEQSNVIVVDRRKKIRGLACTSWQKPLIIQMCVKMGVIFDNKIIKHYRDNAVNTFSQNHMLAPLGLETEEELEEQDIDILASAMYILKETKPKVCVTLKQWFIDRGIVVYE